MLFNSLSYMAFLPVVFIIYWLIPSKYRKWLLLVASYYFYMSWDAKYVVLILFTTAVSYIAALCLEKKKTGKKYILVGAAIICLSVLFFFKYFNFASVSISTVFSKFAIPLSPITLHLVLPVGISFYTFQTLSYVIDVYRGDVPAEKNFFTYATFISFFPQLVAGPIERTSNLLPQIKADHIFDCETALDGAKRMLWGYYKKLVIADNVGIYVDTVYKNLGGYTGFDFLLVIFLFTIQIYCDFSGYSDIAIGTAKLLDIRLMDNFKSPYLSASVKEFWSRWHISLSTWFRDYVYIPLGGNRCSKIRQMRNLLITFLLSGLWHGANWTFVIWGGIHGIAQILEKLGANFLGRIRENKVGHAISVLVVFLFCNIAWVFFRARSLQDAIYVLMRAFGGVLDGRNYWSSQLMPRSQFLLLLFYISILFVYDFIDYCSGVRQWMEKKSTVIQWGILIIVGLMVVFCSKKGVAAEFVYFQF